MGFSSLQAHEKEAFFALLDEYFQSRPEIFANLSGGSQGATANAVSAAAMHRASDVTSKIVSAGLRHAANNSSRPIAGGGGGNADTTASESEVSSVADRVAAFSLQRNSHLLTPASSTNNAERPSSASGLNSVKKMGDVDTSSAKNFFGGLRNSNNLKSASPPPTPMAPPPAFAQKQSSFTPPPVRRAASNANPRVAAPEFSAPPPPPPPRPRQQEEEAGDWADVIYDYDSGEAGDLVITEGDTVLITERTSDDWWTGEVNGKKGLFPASYVKLR